MKERLKSYDVFISDMELEREREGVEGARRGEREGEKERGWGSLPSFFISF